MFSSFDYVNLMSLFFLFVCLSGMHTLKVFFLLIGPRYDALLCRQISYLSFLSNLFIW